MARVTETALMTREPAVRANTATGAEAMVRLLEGHGVRHIFGLCGDTSLPFYDALARLDHGIEHILTRDERHAAYMADAYARVTGRPGICEGPSGGGATYILPGLVEANESSVPILAITSDVSTNSAGRFPLTELDQDALFRPLTKWNGLIRSAEVLPRMVRRAFREMTSGRGGSVHLGLPFDVQKATVPEDDIWVTVPIEPGILPVTNYQRVVEFSATCGASLPPWMGELFEGLDDDPATRRLVAAAVAAEQCRVLHAAGVRHFHFYTLNRAGLVYAICHILGVRPKDGAGSPAPGTER